MYADLGSGLEADIGPQSPDGSSIFYSHEYVAARIRRRAARHATESKSVFRLARRGHDGESRPSHRSDGHDPVRRGSSDLDPAVSGGGEQNLYRYVGNAPTAATDPTGLDRRIIMWLSHMIIEVQDPNTGGTLWLQFGPNGYTVGPPENLPLGTFAAQPWAQATPAEDAKLVALWRQHEADRKAGKRWNWSLWNNCWVPPLGDIFYGINPPPPPPAAIPTFYGGY